MCSRTLLIGPVGTHDGLPFSCKGINLQFEIFPTFANIEIRYIFENSFRDAELYFPIGELRNAELFSWTLNGELVGCELEEQTKDGAKRRRSVMTDSRGKVIEKDASQSSRRAEAVQTYYVWQDDRLTDLEIGAETTVCVNYKCIMLKEKGKFCMLFPLTVLPIAPTEFTMKIKMNKSISRVTSPNVPDRIYCEINKMDVARAECTVLDPETIRLEEKLFVTFVELGEPITPQCADPMTIFILVSFCAILLFCSYFQR